MTKQTDFINSVKQGAIKGWKEYKVLPSLTIAQAILESGWGESGLSVQANNFFGIKADKTWTGAYVTKSTREVYNGKSVYVDARFRKYASKDDSIEDHAKFLSQFERYKNVIGETDYVKATNEIQKAGYATDPKYASLLQSIIRSNNLVEIDKEAFASVAPQPKPVSIPDTYTVQSGDNLTKISQRFGVSIATIQSLNGISNPNLIRVGQVLKLKAPTPKPQPKPVNKYDFLPLQKGDRGEEVKRVQRFLGLKQDGIFGNETYLAVKRYQRMRGITVDGIVGKVTYTNMFGN